MLVITRKLTESLVIGENIRITVLEVGKDRVRLGIDAPKNIKIVREELFDTERQNLEAASPLSKTALEHFLREQPSHKAPIPEQKPDDIKHD